MLWNMWNFEWWSGWYEIIKIRIRFAKPKTAAERKVRETVGHTVISHHITCTSFTWDFQHIAYRWCTTTTYSHIVNQKLCFFFFGFSYSATFTLQTNGGLREKINSKFDLRWHTPHMEWTRMAIHFESGEAKSDAREYSMSIGPRFVVDGPFIHQHARVSIR